MLSHHYMLSSSCSQKQTYLNFCLPLAFRLHVELLLRWWVTSVASLCFHGKSGECLTKPKTLIAFFSFYPPNDWVEIYKHCNWIKVKTAIEVFLTYEVKNCLFVTKTVLRLRKSWQTSRAINIWITVVNISLSNISFQREFGVLYLSQSKLDGRLFKVTRNW